MKIPYLEYMITLIEGCWQKQCLNRARSNQNTLISMAGYRDKQIVSNSVTFKSFWTRLDLIEFFSCSIGENKRFRLVWFINIFNLSNRFLFNRLFNIQHGRTFYIGTFDQAKHFICLTLFSFVWHCTWLRVCSQVRNRE